MRGQYDFIIQSITPPFWLFPDARFIFPKRPDAILFGQMGQHEQGLGRKNPCRSVHQFEPRNHWSGAEARSDEKGMKTLRNTVAELPRCLFGNSRQGLLRIVIPGLGLLPQNRPNLSPRVHNRPLLMRDYSLGTSNFPSEDDREYSGRNRKRIATALARSPAP